jgi:hypothetical protein
MKVVCINNNNGWEKWLTIGKTYDIITINEYGDYIIIDDNNHEDWYPNEWFKPLSEIRNEKINKLLE